MRMFVRVGFLVSLLSLKVVTETQNPPSYALDIKDGQGWKFFAGYNHCPFYRLVGGEEKMVLYRQEGRWSVRRNPEYNPQPQGCDWRVRSDKGELLFFQKSDQNRTMPSNYGWYDAKNSIENVSLNLHSLGDCKIWRHHHLTAEKSYVSISISNVSSMEACKEEAKDFIDETIDGHYAVGNKVDQFWVVSTRTNGITNGSIDCIYHKLEFLHSLKNVSVISDDSDVDATITVASKNCSKTRNFLPMTPRWPNQNESLEIITVEKNLPTSDGNKDNNDVIFFLTIGLVVAVMALLVIGIAAYRKAKRSTEDDEIVNIDESATKIPFHFNRDGVKISGQINTPPSSAAILQGDAACGAETTRIPIQYQQDGMKISGIIKMTRKQGYNKSISSP